MSRNKGIILGLAALGILGIVVLSVVSHPAPAGSIHAAPAPDGDSGIGALFLIVGLVIGVLVYFVPWFVADKRGHANKMAIGVLNLFLGWTFIGWVIALVWACTGPSRVNSPSQVHTP